MVKVSHPFQTHHVVSISRNGNGRPFVLHVYHKTVDPWNHVLVVVEIGQQVHYRVTNLTVDRFPTANADKG